MKTQGVNRYLPSHLLECAQIATRSAVFKRSPVRAGRMLNLTYMLPPPHFVNTLIFSTTTQCRIVDLDVASGCAMEGEPGVCRNFPAGDFCTGTTTTDFQVRNKHIPQWRGRGCVLVVFPSLARATGATRYPFYWQSGNFSFCGFAICTDMHMSVHAVSVRYV